MRDDDPRRWRMLAVIAIAELLGMALWFTGSAVGPTVAQAWHLSASQVGWLTTAVQLGFVLGTALSALLNLADVVPSRRLFAMAAVAGAACNLPLAFTNSFAVACASRALAGVCLAGVYPPAMKMASTWFRERRGFAVGTIVGALTIGKATPYLAQAFPSLGVMTITIASSCSALIAALLIWTRYHDGPYDFPARAFAWSRLGEVWRERRWRMALGGYLGHMAELYSFWTWIPAFLLASDAARAAAVGGERQPRLAAAIGFAVIAVGGAGCVWGGLVADKIGREKLVTLALAISGACALAIGFAWGQSFWVLAPLALVWGFFVIADSAQFSVLATESVPAHVVGTALTLQVSLGFLLTTLTIQAIPPLVAAYGWPSVFRVLAIGPALGIVSIRGMRTRR